MAMSMNQVVEFLFREKSHNLENGESLAFN